VVVVRIEAPLTRLTHLVLDTNLALCHTALMTTDTLTTAKVYAEFRVDSNGRKEIFARDLTDLHNEPAIYTKTVRGIDKAWTAILATNLILTDMSLSDVNSVLREHKVRTHYWCMVD
jgi:hypothetical protein